MGDITMNSLHSIMPELFLCLSAMVLLMYGVYARAKADGINQVLALSMLAMTMAFVIKTCGAPQTVMNGMFITDAFACFSKLLILGAAMLVLLFSSGWLREEGGRPFEFIILVLFATLGMMFMVSAADFLTLYVGLEMASLSLYVLASFQRDHAKSSEAGLKYFVLGALASGMLLFGISLVYGFTGTTSFDSLAALFGAGGEVSKAVILSLVLVMVGFCFKLSAAPFHMWAPDVYEGAPTPVTAFFATAPKVAAFALFTRVLLQPFGELFAQWQQVIIFAAIASMLVGALAAIMQTNIKRLLAYSSIGHVGFIFMAIAAGTPGGIQALLIYLALYIFMSAGAFGCVLAMKRAGEPVEDIKSLAGLSQTQPFMAAMLAIFMFSMAGIPPLAGFFGKMYVVLAAIDAGLIWLAVVGVATSVIACYYYLKVVKVMYFDTPAKHFDSSHSFACRVAMVVAVSVTTLFFLLPTPLVTHAKAAADSLFVTP